MGIIWLIAFVEIVLLAGGCGLLYLWAVTTRSTRMNTEKYVKLEEWAEDWMKRLEQKCEANENHIAKCAAKIAEMENMLPKTGNGEIVRNQVLLQQLNDEMEKSLSMEREWNEGVAAILNYGKPRGE